MDQNEAKRMAAQAALRELPEQGIVGLGSGSTTKLFIDALGELAKDGRAIQCVPTSEASRRQALSLGLVLLDDQGPWEIDVNVDGADEVDRALNLIKGGGGAQTREKIVNYASKRNVIIVDESKLSERLGEKWKVPIEVLLFARGMTERHLSQFGKPELRFKEGAPVVTDSGNVIYDLKVDPIVDPSALDSSLRAIPGVVETGLFVGRADVVLVATSSGVVRYARGE